MTATKTFSLFETIRFVFTFKLDLMCAVCISGLSLNVNTKCILSNSEKVFFCHPLVCKTCLIVSGNKLACNTSRHRTKNARGFLVDSHFTELLSNSSGSKILFIQKSVCFNTIIIFYWTVLYYRVRTEKLPKLNCYNFWTNAGKQNLK